VLPFDYAAHAAEWIAHLGELSSLAGDRFDLRTAIARAQDLQSRVLRLQSVAEGANGDQARAVNECLKKLGRALIPANYTRAGRFGQDPALAIPAFPDLEPVRTLAALPEGSDEARFVEVRLVRARNRIVHALSCAGRIAGEALVRMGA
jgi:hypothetical protein